MSRRSVTGVAFDTKGRLYVAESGNQRIQVFTLDTGGAPVWVKSLDVTEQRGSDNNRSSA